MHYICHKRNKLYFKRSSSQVTGERPQDRAEKESFLEAGMAGSQSTQQKQRGQRTGCYRGNTICSG